MDPRSTLVSLRTRELLDRAQADVADLLDSVAHHLVPPGVPREWMHAVSERSRPRPRHRMMPLLEQFARLRPNAFFVQIGANDGDGQDPLRDTILRHNWSGIMVEPLPYIYARLRANYGHLGRLTLENVAIASRDGPKPFYYLEAATDGVGRSLPAWCDGLGSFRREVVLAHRSLIKDIETRVAEIEVPSLTFASLCDRHQVERVDLLLTDTEGYDAEILKSVSFDRVRPTLILYESFHLSPEDKAACVERLHAYDYETIEYDLDTWCFNRHTLPKPDADALEPFWCWLADPARGMRQLAATRALRATARRALGRARKRSDPTFGALFVLTDADRRYLTAGYDDRTPLPVGAPTYLSRDNPRLRELTDRYRQLDIPAVNHHMWSPEAVSAQLDLRYFRGDNVYVWHYADHPRAMELMLFIYMRYLLAQGGGHLIDVLAEDGAFGAWTADVPRYGKLSRDRLDSASEILFLERKLSVLQHKGIRILDIGAGYGRFAHRMAQAHVDLGDYCCVDAVPESTFLSEYYLRCRDVSPPTRVVALDEVPSLEAGEFDLAVNIHSFSECTLAAIEWWVAQLRRLQVPYLFVIPNEPQGITSREPDGSTPDAMPTITAAGYKLTAVEPVMSDPAVRDLVRIHDNFHLFALEAAIGSG